MANKNFKKKILFLSCATLLVSASCGQSSSSSTSPSALIANGGKPVSSAIANSTVLSAITGNFYGTLTMAMDSAVDEPYALTISQTQSSGQTFLTMNFSSASGNFAAALDPSVESVSGTDTLYTFVTTAAQASGLSPDNIALEITIAVTQSNTFDPAQSTIYFVDCGFSQACDTLSSNASVSVNLGKR